MKRKELTKIVMMISNLKKPFGLHGLYKISVVRANINTKYIEHGWKSRRFAKLRNISSQKSV